jgi:PiT family inorganic phosphate transporter
VLLMGAVLLLIVAALAFANGANDVSKGIATLVGSGVSHYRLAVTWGTIWTMAGALTAAVATQSLVATFSGKGLLATPRSGPAFLLAVACGAVAWLLIATRTGLPVSTTHALTGALCGAGIAAAGVSGVVWTAVAAKAALPLAVSPLLSLVIVLALHPLAHRVLARADPRCVCIAEAVTPEGFVAPMLKVGTTEECAQSAATTGGVTLVDGVHWLTSGATSFFRGLNDTPKIAALAITAAAAFGFRATPVYALIAVAMGAGSLLWGFRVTRTLAEKVTPISPADGLLANLVTSALVATASFVALPVSTTHVSTGAIIGSGIARDAKLVRWKAVSEMLLAWVVTLPVAALLGWTAYRLAV